MQLELSTGEGVRANQAGPRVGVLYPVPNWQSTYSLASIVKQQVEALTGAGSSVRIIGSQSGEAIPYAGRDVDTRRCVPLSFVDESDDSIGEVEIDRLSREITLHLEGLDWVITHDLIGMRRFVDCEAAVGRAAASRPELKWLHVMHYDPARLFESRFDPGRDWPGDHVHFAYLSPSQATDAASLFGRERVVCLPNGRSLAEVLAISARVASVVDLARLVKSDVTIVHPWSLVRCALKQPHHMVFTARALADLGLRTYMIFADPKSGTREEYMTAKLGLRWLAKSLSVEDQLVFFSDSEESARGLSQAEMSELYRLSNVFMQSSFREGSPLALVEAMAHNNLCVLNDSIPSLRDIAGDHAIYKTFHDLRHDKLSLSPRECLRWYRDHHDEYAALAMRITERVQHDPLMAARRRVYDTFFGEQAHRAIPDFINKNN